MRNFLYLVKRTDEYKDNCWGDNLDMVVCSNSEEHIEQMILDNILTNSAGQRASKFDGKDLERTDIEVTLIGKAVENMTPGVVLMTNAGA